MSGGHYDYSYIHVNDMAFQIRKEARKASDVGESVPRDPREVADRRKIAAYLLKVSEAMHALEWCDSGDTCWADARKRWVTLGVLRKTVKK